MRMMAAHEVSFFMISFIRFETCDSCASSAVVRRSRMLSTNSRVRITWSATSR